MKELLKMTQKSLFEHIKEMFPKCISRKRKYILVQGEIPLLLVAHLDTVHKKTVRNICTDGNIWMSPQGIGGDDRCGVYALLELYKYKKPWLLFTCDEEVGGLGAGDFVKDIPTLNLPKFKFAIEIDRKGKSDAVYYDVGNGELEKYITKKGFKTQYGSYTDICTICPELDIAGVNLSSGYYNAHTQHEYININHLNKTISRVKSIIDDIDVLPEYECEYTWGADYWSSRSGHWDDIPEEVEMEFYALLDLYRYSDLMDYYKDCGAQGIIELYKSDIQGGEE